jgi:hypothetical protein
MTENSTAIVEKVPDANELICDDLVDKAYNDISNIFSEYIENAIIN